MTIGEVVAERRATSSHQRTNQPTNSPESRPNIPALSEIARVVYLRRLAVRPDRRLHRRTLMTIARRAGMTLAVAGSVLTLAAAAPRAFSPGYTYRMRISGQVTEA